MVLIVWQILFHGYANQLAYLNFAIPFFLLCLYVYDFSYIYERHPNLLFQTIIDLGKNQIVMGKGDKKTRRGKIVNKSFGVRRTRPKKK